MSVSNKGRRGGDGDERNPCRGISNTWCLSVRERRVKDNPWFSGLGNSGLLSPEIGKTGKGAGVGGKMVNSALVHCGDGGVCGTAM